ncbi:hypothetical protein E2C01_050006 [Portunus trituberculatus]|uniref:Uncharacterized protein n=1 Tax=Portunus trituberculatus TaxID=210409 RepID=A0A5B7GES9_PORTR|nr:hypothetical protein [Portunus trituberculatus]
MAASLHTPLCTLPSLSCRPTHIHTHIRARTPSPLLTPGRVSPHSFLICLIIHIPTSIPTSVSDYCYHNLFPIQSHPTLHFPSLPCPTCPAPPCPAPPQLCGDHLDAVLDAQYVGSSVYPDLKKKTKKKRKKNVKNEKKINKKHQLLLDVFLSNPGCRGSLSAVPWTPGTTRYPPRHSSGSTVESLTAADTDSPLPASSSPPCHLLREVSGVAQVVVARRRPWSSLAFMFSPNKQVTLAPFLLVGPDGLIVSSPSLLFMKKCEVMGLSIPWGWWGVRDGMVICCARQVVWQPVTVLLVPLLGWLLALYFA